MKCKLQEQGWLFFCFTFFAWVCPSSIVSLGLIKKGLIKSQMLMIDRLCSLTDTKMAVMGQFALIGQSQNKVYAEIIKTLNT